MAMLEDVQQFLVAQSCGTRPSNRQAWPIYIGMMPDDDISPDRAIAMYELMGHQPPDQWNVLYPRLMVYVRGAIDYDYSAARAKADAIFTALHSTTASIGSTYRSVLATSSAPVFEGYDAKNRPRFSWTFDVIRQTY